MKLVGKYNENNDKKYLRKEIFLLTTVVTIIFLISGSLIGIFTGSLQLALAQQDTTSSENLWSERTNVTTELEIPGQRIITFLNGSIPEASINALADEAENAGIEVVSVIPELGVMVVNISESSIPALADTLENTDAFISTEPNRIRTADGQSLPSGIDRIDAERSLDSSSRSASTTTTAGNNSVNTRPINATIGILDTGVDQDNEDLEVIESVSFSDDSPDVDDVDGHGTHVAGIAAAKDNGMGVVGVAPGAKIISIKVLNNTGYGSTLDILEGLAYVLANPEKFDVINISLGGLGVSNAENNAISRIVAAGVPVVVSAGNNNLSARYHSPASAEDAITVSASYDGDGKCGGLGPTYERRGEIVNDDSFAPYSNHGDVVDIMAPGTRINSTQPGNSTHPGGTFASFSGTSMAAPHVAGAIALYKSIYKPLFPDISPDNLEDIVNDNAVYPSGNVCETTAINGRGYVDMKRDDDDAQEPHLYIGTLAEDP